MVVSHRPTQHPRSTRTCFQVFKRRQEQLGVVLSVSRSIIEIHSNLMGRNEPTIQRSIRATRVKKRATEGERFDD